jgi:acyl carrier protein
MKFFPKEDGVTNDQEVYTKIKQVIANIAGLDQAKIPDGASLRDDLKLDSLSLLEIGVDVDLAFQLNLPDEKYKEIESLPQMVALVQQRRREMAAGPLAGLVEAAQR